MEAPLPKPVGRRKRKATGRGKGAKVKKSKKTQTESVSGTGPDIFSKEETGPDLFSEEQRNKAIAGFHKWMEHKPKSLEAGLEKVKKEFDIGKNVVKQKDVMLQLLERSKKRNGFDALEAVIDYVIDMIYLFRGFFKPLLRSWGWNKDVAKCVYSTKKFNKLFFAPFEELDKIYKAAKRLIKLGEAADEEEEDWLVTAGCVRLREMVFEWVVQSMPMVVKQGRLAKEHPDLTEAIVKRMLIVGLQ